MLKSFYDELLKINLFYSSYKLKFNQSNKLESFIGLFFTICMLGLCLSLVITSGSDMIYRTKQNINSNTINLEENKRVNITDSTLMFSFYTDIPIEILRDKRMFTIEIGNFLVNRLGTSEGPYESEKEILLDWEVCGDNLEYYLNKFNYYQNFTDLLLKNGFQNNICIKNMDNITIGGLYTKDFFSNIFFRLKRCVNQTDGDKDEVSCFSDEEIDKTFSESVYFNIYIRDAYIDTANYDNPIFYVVNNFYWMLDKNFKLSVDIYNKESQLETDIGIIFEEFKQHRVLHFDYMRELLTSVNRNDGILLDLYINTSNRQSNISRRYMKFQELAAMIGGIIKAYMIVAEIICYYFYKHIEFESMFNSFCKLTSNQSSISAQELFNSYKSGQTCKNKYEFDQFRPNVISTFQNLKPEKFKKEVSLNNDNSVDALKKGKLKFSVLNIIQDAANNKKINLNVKIINKSNSNNSEYFSNLNINFIRLLSIDFLFCCEKFNQQRKIIVNLKNNLNKKVDFKEIIYNNLLVDRITNVLFSEEQKKLITFDLKYKINLESKDNQDNNPLTSQIKEFEDVYYSVEKMIDNNDVINEKIINTLIN